MSESSSSKSRGSSSHWRVLSLRDVRWFELDWHVAVIAGVLLALGLVFVSAIADADQLFGRGGPEAVNFRSHLQKVALTSPLVLIGLALRPRWLRRNAWAVYASALALLVFVQLFGTVRNGSKSWIELPIGFDLQPSELAKVAMILMLAAALTHNRLRRPRDWYRPVLFALVPMGLVVIQPDLGTALSMAPVAVGMLYLGGARGAVIGWFFAGVAALALTVVTFQLGLHDYQLQRVRTWTESFRASDLIEARSGPAFHVYQARVAIGNGELFGQGIGQGIANETGFLPERDCDSVFAVVAEETGWVGATVVLALYALLVASIFGSASSLRDRFSRLVVGGVGLFFASHLFINVGVNVGLLPLTGLTLPLFSTGGSSMAATFLCLGLALGLAAHREPSLDQDTFRA